jgi:hypothetical protein
MYRSEKSNEESGDHSFNSNLQGLNSDGSNVDIQSLSSFLDIQ